MRSNEFEDLKESILQAGRIRRGEAKASRSFKVGPGPIDPINLPDGTEVKVDAVEEQDIEKLHPELRRFLGILPEHIDVKKEYYEGMLRKHQ